MATALVSFSGPVKDKVPFGQFKATASGLCTILVGVGTAGIHLSMADQSLDGVFRCVNSNQPLPIGDWYGFSFPVVENHEYAFRTNADCALALVVTAS